MNEENNILNDLKQSGENQAGMADPFVVPDGYFTSFTQHLLDRISDEQAVPAVLKDVSKKMAYAVPPGYFNNLGVKINHPANSASTNRIRRIYSWRHLVAAAVTIGIIVLISVLFIQQNNQNGGGAASFAQQKIKTVPTEQLKSFLNSTDNNISQNSALSSTKSDNKVIDFNQLFEKIPDKDLKIFLEETGGIDDDFLIN